jgi:rubrerythrin
MSQLTENEIRALNEALDDEYRAWTTYRQVITDFGEVQPFSNIIDAEARHIRALSALFARYGLAILENRWPGDAARYAGLQVACEAGAAAEMENEALYRRLMGSTKRPDILAVFRDLQAASQERHLPAFQRCIERSAGGAAGRGRAWRRLGRRNRA